MRLISCVALLMVIPAVALLTRENKFAEHKTTDAAPRGQTVKDSVSFSLISTAYPAPKVERTHIVVTSDYGLTFVKTNDLNSPSLFTINKTK